MNPLALIPGRLWLAALAAAVCCLAMFGVWLQGRALMTAQTRLAVAQDAVRTCRASGQALAAALHELQQQGRDERHAARRSAGEEALACDERVARARRQALGIADLINRPVAQDSRGCPAREIMEGIELDAAIPNP